ncbi:MAG: hypothetical protein P4L92_11755 [Rudaea sp.]|nr:hypothetical protein [Rudaea sp.]
MSAAPDLLRRLRESGIRLKPRGDRLHVEAAPGTVTPELRIILAENKADLVAALSADTMRARLLALASAERINATLIDKLHDTDLVACIGLGDNVLRAYICALADGDLREHGKRPPDETAPAQCRHCGLVWVHPHIASAAPVVDGWPRLLGCPWCTSRQNGFSIPRPGVAF